MKTYLRYLESVDSGVIASASSNSMSVLTLHESKQVAVLASLEYVSLYDLRTGQLIERLCPSHLNDVGPTAEVTAITTATEGKDGKFVHVAIGYANGCISFWTLSSSSSSSSSSSGSNAAQYRCIFFGQSHKPDTAVLSVSIDTLGGRLLSSGQDTDITVWDLTTHEPMYRLCGHRGAVVNAVFCSAHNNSNNNGIGSKSNNNNNLSNLVVSGSADGLVKVWDLSVQSCVETIVASDTQVTSIAVASNRIFIGLRDDHIKVFSISTSSTSTSSLTPYGSLKRKTNKPPTSITFAPDGKHMLVTTSANVEIFKVLTNDEIIKKVQRKLRRRKEAEKRKTKSGLEEGGGEGDQEGEEYDRHSSAKKRRIDNSNSDQNQQQQQQEGEGEEAATTKKSNENNNNTNSTEWQQSVTEEILPLRLFMLPANYESSKIRSALVLQPQTSSSSSSSIRILVATNDNNVAIFESKFQDPPQQQQQQQAEKILGEWKKTKTDIGAHQQHHAHQKEVRKILFDSQDMQLASISSDSIKLWFVSEAAQQRSRIHANEVNEEAFQEGIEEQRCMPQLVCSSTFVMSDLHSMCISDDVAGNFVQVSNNSNNVQDENSATASSSSPSSSILQLHASSAAFLPGDDLLAVSTLEGRIVILGISSNSVVSVIVAHSGPILDFISCTGNKKEKPFHNSNNDYNNNDYNNNYYDEFGYQQQQQQQEQEEEQQENNNDGDGTVVVQGEWFITCGKDRRVTKWRIALVDPDDLSTTTLEATGEEAELNNTPLALSLVPGDQLLAVALQDFTVHLFYVDTFRPFLTLYGHKLPVSSVGFSRDGSLCATVGMDKSLRFWGVDFGDCHRSIHAHDNYVHGVTFLGRTHQVATVSLDGSLKIWDGDTWQLIQQFKTHQRGVLCLASNRNGTCIATAGVDRNIRVFLRSEEMLFPEEELAQAAQKAADTEAARKAAMKRLDQVEVGDVGIVAQKTVATAEAAEHLMSALDAVSVELQRRAAIESGEDPAVVGQPSFEMQQVSSPYGFFWRAVERIKPSQLRHALSSITQQHMHSLLQFLVGAVHEGAVGDYEIASRVVMALVKPAPGSNSLPVLLFPDPKEASRVLSALGAQISKGLQRDTNRVATNVAGLDFMLHRLEQENKVKINDRSKIQGAARKFAPSALKSSVGDEQQVKEVKPVSAQNW